MKQVRAEILSTRKLGAYHSLTLVAPEIAEKARPGQFLAVKMPEGREFLLRRQFAIESGHPMRISPTVGSARYSRSRSPCLNSSNGVSS